MSVSTKRRVPDVPAVTEVNCVADCSVANVKEDAIIQFDRKGYFRYDRAFKAGEPAIFFQIPTGRGGR